MRGLMAMVLAAAVGCGRPPTPEAVIPVPARPAPETVDNPEYVSWADTPVGTVVVRRTTTAGKDGPGVTVTTTNTTLVERTTTALKLERQETTRRYDGEVFENPPERVTVPVTIPLAPGMTKADFGRPSNSETAETLTAGGVSYPTRCSTGKGQNEAGEMQSRTWVADRVPGRLVKAVVTTPAVGKTVTTELIEVRRPPATP